MGIAAVTPTPSEKGEVKVAQVRAKRKIPKLVTLDQTIELKRTKLAEWRDGYLTNMEAARAAKDHREAEKIAKGDAEIWVWGFGIFSNVPPNCPLFSQSFLKNLVLGKRVGDAEDTERPAKTRRISNLEGQDSEQEFGRNAPHVPFQDDNQDYGADDIEVGREQEASAAGGSSMMPWNQISSRTLRFGSSELQSMQQGRDGSSAAVSMLNTPLASSRRVSGIRGRGLSSKRSDDFANVALQPLTSVDDDVEELLQEDPGEDFEVFRNGTSNDNANLDDNVDSQNMDTQLLLASMERESYNFFEYLKMELEQRSSSSIFMAELVPPTSSRAIAAQAFHHSLQLATKSLISLHQNPNSMEIVFQLAE